MILFSIIYPPKQAVLTFPREPEGPLTSINGAPVMR